MLKLTFCLVRAPQLTHEEFVDHWTHVHAPLVRQFREVLRIQRYTQTPIAPPKGVPPPSPDIPFDGVAELVWASVEDYGVRTREPAAIEATEALAEDSRKFMRMSRCVPLWGWEQPIF